MGWWGDRAKDGDHPLDLVYRWEQSGKSAKAFVNAELQKALKEEDDDYQRTSWVGLVTLLCEKGKTFNADIYKQALKWSTNSVDRKFFEQMLGTGVPMTKQKFVITMRIEVEEMDEEEAVRKACEYAKLAEWNNIIKDQYVKMEVNGKPHTKIYSDNRFR